MTRRTALKVALAGATATLAAPKTIAAANDKILIGVPSSLSTPYGVADDTDHLNGTKLAVEEINAAGGVLGREIELFVPDVDKLSPESCQQAIAACIDKKVQAISNAFLFAPIPAMDESAKYKCPYLQGNTQRAATEAFKANPAKYSHMLQTDPSEVNYGWTYPLWLTKMEETGVWKPKNRKIHIVAEQVGYCQTILKAAKESIPKYNFELAQVTDIQYPVNDWSPVIQKLKEVDAGAIMIDHWVAAEYAAFCKQFASPIRFRALSSICNMAPLSPSSCNLAAPPLKDSAGAPSLVSMATRRVKTSARSIPPVSPNSASLGLVYTGNGYDIVQYLKRSWEATGKTEDFAANCKWIRENPYRGVCGMMDMNNEFQEALHYPG